MFNIMLFEDIALKIPEIIIPQDHIDLNKWSVIACDQFTSDENYWKNVEKHINNHPSTYNLIYPEVYLHHNNKKQIFSNIKKSFAEYKKNNIFKSLGSGLMMIERHFNDNRIRKGLIACLDLEQYDFTTNDQLIRASEETIPARLTPRIEIRKNINLELFHTIILIDDKNNLLFDALNKIKPTLKKIYDFSLMSDGGNIKGYFINQEDNLNVVVNNLKKLKKDNFLYAIGDGNHSFSSAKVLWERTKKEIPKNLQKNHPLRYSLVEIINIYDEGLIFEPIHRILFNINSNHFFNSFKSFCNKTNIYFEHHKIKEEEFNPLLNNEKNNYNYGYLNSPDSPAEYIYTNFQSFLQEYLLNNDKSDNVKNDNVKIDYIHGSNELIKLCQENNQENNKSLGFIMPSIDKNRLFKIIEEKGSLPRKSFSLGTSTEKRFYLEGRYI